MNILQKLYIPTILNKNSRSYNAVVIALLLIFLILGIFLSIGVGSSKLTLPEIAAALSNEDVTSNTYQIINYVRIPRMFAALLAGSALSVSGLILQSVLNNSLASPNVIGVNAGSGLFVVLITAVFHSYMNLVPVAAFAGALIAVFLVYFIAKNTGASRMTIVLAGIAVSNFIGAITDTVLTMVPDAAISRTAFMIGGFSSVTMENTSFAAMFIVVGLIVSIIFSYDMNVLTLGDETAKSLGLNVNRYRFIFLIIAALLAGSAISFSGLIGFIGLIVPHAARFLAGNDNRFITVVCVLLGSSFTLFCDILARVLFAPYEIPVGIIMSFLGGPFFIYLLLKKKRGKVYD